MTYFSLVRSSTTIYRHIYLQCNTRPYISSYLSRLPPIRVHCSHTPYYLQGLKSIKTQEFMPYVIFIQCAHVDTMRIMHDKAYRKRKTNRKRTVTCPYCYCVAYYTFPVVLNNVNILALTYVVYLLFIY